MIARPPRRTAAAEARQGRPAVPRDPLPGYTPRGALRGRRALLMGGLADGGPGRAVAAALAKEGAAVALADTTGLPGLPPGAQPVPRQRLGDDPVLLAAGLVSALGAWSLAIHCDPASAAQGRAAVAHTALEFGAVDLLVVHGGAAGAVRDEGRMGGPGVAVGAAAPAPRTRRGARLTGALRVAREARPFLGEGAAAVLLVRRSEPEVSAAPLRAELRTLAGAMHGRRARLNCLIPRAADTDAGIAAAVAELAAGGGRSGEVVGVAQVAHPR
ncbi:hypothetical protein [Streptomonospora litoralis]|uniref:3-ketoacyl-(Acyl-carrier-protein) reductase n=1 Tax=Streptomonospora litoralis TaxID=2498135 RepID=A0A4V0ZJ58_9ACTN|nr:hypothetical protein [Streptomonospora litoralis]QBI52332.1 3-ketoacyl-(acyl-carrier-protein) reductase [Streptomonospora litoralis]